MFNVMTQSCIPWASSVQLEEIGHQKVKNTKNNIFADLAIVLFLSMTDSDGCTSRDIFLCPCQMRKLHCGTVQPPFLDHLAQRRTSEN